MLQHCIVCAYKSILNLIEKFFYIINDRYSEAMCAKYCRSRMNDVCTVCPANFVSLPAKVVQLTAFFLKKKVIFVWLLCWPPASQPGSQLLNCV